jgi:hypothetical protein
MDLVGFCYIGCLPGIRFDSAGFSSSGLEICRSGLASPLETQDISWCYPHTVQSALPRMKGLCRRFGSDKFVIRANVLQDGNIDSGNIVNIIVLELYISTNLLGVKIELPGISSIISNFSDTWEHYVKDLAMELPSPFNGLKACYLETLSAASDIASASSWIKHVYESLPHPLVMVNGQQRWARTQGPSERSLLLSPTSRRDLPPAPTDVTAHLQRLPAELVRLMLGFLDAKSQCRCASSSKFLHHCYLDHLEPPGLLLTLYRHQRAALQWMMERESASYCGAVSFQVRSLRAWDSSRRVSVHLLNDECIVHKLVHTEAEATPALLSLSSRSQFRGGMLCDEPGLGKTITALALILRTLGGRPACTVTVGDVDCRLRRPRPRDDENDNADSGAGAAKASRSSKRTIRSNTLLFPSSPPRLALAPVKRVGVADGDADADRGAHLLATKQLHQSPATLLIVPDVLVKQWAFQINTHISTRLSIYSGFAADRLLYVDQYSAASPEMLPASVLAEFVIVLVPFS